MFKLFLYRIKSLAKTPVLIFWSFCFPIILGTMFHLAFGSITERTETFEAVPVAIVTEEGKQENFLNTLKAVSEKNDDALLIPKYVAKKEALSLLQKGKVEGIIYAGDKLRLEVNNEGIEQSLLKSFLDQYLQSESTLQKIAETQPEQLKNAVLALSENTEYIKELPTASGEMDPFIHYFYALIAMACLYGCFYGLSTAEELSPPAAALGARRCISCMRKESLIAIDFLASLFLHFTGLMVLLFYLTVVLGKSFGNKWPLIILVILVGCMAGIGIGSFVGAAMHKSTNAKVATALSATMVMSFLGGLMMGNMQDIIEHHIPILNRINPAALINDALYCLSVYDNYTKFAQRMGMLTAISLILLLASSLVLRRKRYASL